MIDFLTWLIAIELIGIVALPIVYYVTPWLPDRGYSLAKPVALLLVFYPLWLLASTPFIPNSTLIIWLILAALIAVSVWLFRRYRSEIVSFYKREQSAIIIMEAVFIIVFSVVVLFKAYDPSINHTEQPMDFAFLNAAASSQHFPPQDPWLAGESVSYYYLGYLIFGGISRLADVPTYVGYNLALATVAGMAAIVIFGLAYNMVRLVGGRLGSALLTGSAALLLLLGIANLVSGLELVRAGGGGTPGFWEWVDIKGLDGPEQSSEWYPSENGWWWWRATRVIDTVEDGSSQDYTISEFPLFSFLLGDLHPHVMSLPFVLAWLGLMLNFIVAPVRLAIRWGLPGYNTLISLGIMGLFLGALAFINFVDIAVFGAVFVGIAAIKGYSQRRSVWRGFAAGLTVAAPVLAVAVILYLPFYFSFRSQASGVLPVHEFVTRPFHFFMIWGLFLVIVAPFLLWEMAALTRQRNGLKRRAAIAISLAVALLPWVVWSLFQGLLDWDISETMGTAWGRLIHVLPIALLIAMAVYGALLRSRASAEGGMRQSALAMTFVLAMAAVALLLVMGPELFRILDLFGNRMNTVFKLSYQAWALFAVVGAFALYYIVSRFDGMNPALRLAAYGWAGVLAVGVLVSFYYLPAAAYTKSSGPSGSGTLDGLAYVEAANPSERFGIEWLRENAGADDRIVEAVGDSYSEHGRISSSTGIPTVLGWPLHEEQWRGSRKPFEGREEDVRTLYQTDNLEEARGILDKYKISYVIVGSREMAKYGSDGLSKFEELGELVFPSPSDAIDPGEMLIYRVG